MNIDKAALRTKIEQLITEAVASISEMEDMTQPVTPENSIGRVSRMDAINNKSEMESALRNKKSKLSRLKVALQSLDDDDFGICKMCKRAIQDKRLIYMPESTYCVRCAARH